MWSFSDHLVVISNFLVRPSNVLCLIISFFVNFTRYLSIFFPFMARQHSYLKFFFIQYCALGVTGGLQEAVEQHQEKGRGSENERAPRRS